MRVGSAEVGGLIEAVEFGAGARSGLDVDHRASTSAAAGGCARARAARGSSCACSTAWRAAGSGRGWPSSSAARSCGATSSGRSRSSSGRSSTNRCAPRRRAGGRHGHEEAAAGTRRRRAAGAAGGGRQAPADARHPDRRQQLGRHRRPRRPAPLQGPQAPEHRARQGRSGWPRSSPTRSALGYFMGIRQLVGEGHDQIVDDAFTSPDGRLLYVSRPSFADVVAIRLKTGAIAWRTQGRGQPRRPHGDLAGRHAAARVGLDGAQGARDRHPHGRDRRQLRVRRPAAREQLLRGRHEDLPRQHRHVFTPTDDPLLDATKGDRWFEIVDATTLQVLRRIDMGKKLAEAGYPEHELRGAADERRARTSGSCTSRSRSSTASSSTTSSRTA